MYMLRYVENVEKDISRQKHLMPLMNFFLKNILIKHELMLK